MEGKVIEDGDQLNVLSHILGDGRTRRRRLIVLAGIGLFGVVFALLEG